MAKNKGLKLYQLVYKILQTVFLYKMRAARRNLSTHILF